MKIQSMLASAALPLPVARSGHRLLSTLILTATLGAASIALAQAPTDPNGGRRQRGGGTGGQDANNGGRGNFSPEEAQTRMLAGLRDRFGITNDEEWGLISTRITAVMDLRRATGGGGGFPGGGFRGGTTPGGGGNDPRGGRSTRGGTPEVAALQAAVTDNLPEAEIKSRLSRLRETRKANEAKLQTAQEELRAVLSVKQEATAVLFGLLP
jgi:hypothetical protein